MLFVLICTDKARCAGPPPGQPGRPSGIHQGPRRHHQARRPDDHRRRPGHDRQPAGGSRPTAARRSRTSPPRTPTPRPTCSKPSTSARGSGPSATRRREIMAYWLFKSEPNTWGWHDQKASESAGRRVGRGAQLPGAQQHASHEEGRARLLLSLHRRETGGRHHRDRRRSPPGIRPTPPANGNASTSKPCAMCPIR